MKTIKDPVNPKIERIIRLRSLPGLIATIVAIIGASPSVPAQADSSNTAVGDVVENRQPEEIYDKLILDAAQLIVFNDWGLAFRNLNEALMLDPERPDAYFIYGRAHFIRKEYNAAELAFRKTLEVDPYVAAPWYELAKLLRIKGELNESLECIREAITLTKEEEWEYLVFLGELYAEMELRTSAEQAFDQAIDLIKRRLKNVTKAINRVAREDNIVEIIHETEWVYDKEKKEIVEVPVTRYRTEPSTPPTEWTDESKSLTAALEAVKERKVEVLAWMDEN